MNHAELKCRLLLPSVRCILTVRMALRRHTHALGGRSLTTFVQKVQAAVSIDRHRISKVRKA